MAIERVGLAADLIALGRTEFGFQISLPVDAFARNPDDPINTPLAENAFRLGGLHGSR
jgi:hypothetical protein